MQIEQGREYWTISKTLKQAESDDGEHRCRPRLVRAHYQSGVSWVMHPPDCDEADNVIDLDLASFAEDEDLGRQVFETEEAAWVAYLDSDDGPAARFRQAVAGLREELRQLNAFLEKIVVAPLAGRIPLINHARDLHDLLKGDAT